MKKFISGFVCVAMMPTFLHVGVMAYEPPQEIWASFNKYAEALENKDYENIIKYGLIDLSILEKEPINDTTQNWMCARYQKIAEAYEKLGDYEKSAEMYEKQIPLAKTLGWDDSVKIAQAKSLNYKSNIELYSKTDEIKFNSGAVNEHDRGVLYGIPADSQTNQDNTSMYLLYIEYGDRNFDWERAVLKKATQEGKAVEFAYNMPNQGDDIIYAAERTDYINAVADMLAEFPNVKIYFRFGAEVDIWEKPADPELYKKAFRLTADVIHSKVPNAAMVFSPNMVSSWDRDMMDYYPGDEYADWIGLSLYLMKYFGGDANRSEDTKYMEVVFAAGDSAEPVLMLKKFADNFPDKPIMISESGASHYINTAGEDATGWAKTRLEMLYGYLPMVYPQIKLIAHFDTVISHETNNYALKSNQEILNLYNELTSGGAYIQKSANNAPQYSYHHWEDTIKVKGDNLDLSAYAHVYTEPDLKVNYYIDGNWVASSDKIPYSVNINTAEIADGSHILKVTCEADGTEKYTKEFSLIKGEANAAAKPQQPMTKPMITVLVNGEPLEIADQPPIIEDGRTLVPLRAIFEALGADVDWDNETREVTAVKDDIVIKLAIGSNELYKNDEVKILDVAAKIVNSRTLVPARAVAEAFGANVGWDGTTRTVIIDY